MAAQVGGQAGKAREIALDLAFRDEDPARPAAGTPDLAGALELGEGGAYGRARDLEPFGDFALGPEALPGRELTGGDLAPQAIADRDRRRPQDGYCSSRAIIDSGRV